MPTHPNLWRPGRLPLPLKPGTLHIWRVDLNPGDARVDEVRAILSVDETKRGERYVFPEHRRRFVAGRGALRKILAAYVEAPPEALRFELGPKGKPSLPKELGGERVSFNVSNSHERALIAIGLGQELGVDIEHKRSLTRGESIARRHFAPGEMAALMALPSHRWDDGFFNCWTRKEAFIKVTGEGLSRPLDSFEVSLLPGEPALLRRVDEAYHPDLPWTLETLEPGEGYAGAVCGEGGWEELLGLDYMWAP